MIQRLFLPDLPDVTKECRRNLTSFILYRVLFNCRFYYPVYATMFGDFGLNTGQFVLLNALWAFVIVLFEVPSGALADMIGRRPLVLASAWLMILEMLVLFIAPVGNLVWVFPLFLCNRLLSGASEAAASGADEALAYDSLPKENRHSIWSKVLGRLVMLMAGGFMISAILGSLVYDVGLMNRVFECFGFQGNLTQADTVKFPIFLTLCSSLGCFFVARRMIEVPSEDEKAMRRLGLKYLLNKNAAQIFSVAKWIWKHEFAFVVIGFAVVFDSIQRLFMTIASRYYRWVGIEERWFGFISAGSSLIGILSTGWMVRMALQGKFSNNMLWVSLGTFWGMLVLALGGGNVWGAQSWGIGHAFLLVPLLLSVRMMQYFISVYLNRESSSENRSTVLSFKSMLMNVAYGGMTLLFGLHTSWVKESLPAEIALELREEAAFGASLMWWPGWFLAVLTLYWIWKRRPIQSLNQKGGE